MNQRPSRPDPATGLTRPGQTQAESPATPYRRPSAPVSVPTPRLGGGSYTTGLGEPGGPMMQAYGRPGIAATPVSAPSLGRGGIVTGMTGVQMPSGNAPQDFAPRMGESAAATRERLVDSVQALVRRNGGNPADVD